MLSRLDHNDDNEVAAASRRIRLAIEDAVWLQGFSFHLPGYDPVPRAALAAALVERCRYARSVGHPATTISIGGGFGVDYVPAEQWAEFVDVTRRQIRVTTDRNLKALLYFKCGSVMEAREAVKASGTRTAAVFLRFSLRAQKMKAATMPK